jgi:hypothetical protein
MIVAPDESEQNDINQQGITKEDWLRKEHHNRSRYYIETHWKDLKLDSSDEAIFIGTICQAHRGGNLGTDDRLKIAYPNVRLLGAILRIADELDITQARTPENLLTLRWDEMDDQSKWHWLKHYCVKQSKPRHMELKDDNPNILMLTYHYTIHLPSHKFAEPFWERIVRPIREVIDYEGVDDILRQKHLSIGHRYFTNNVVIHDDLLPDGKPLSEYLGKFLVPPELISREMEGALKRISWENPPVSEMLKSQCKALIDVASRLLNPNRVKDAIDRFLDKLSNVTTLPQIEAARDAFKSVIREVRGTLGTNDLLLNELQTEAYKLADLGWRLMAYVHSTEEHEVREKHIRHLWGWLGQEIDPIISWIIRNDPSPALRKYVLSVIVGGGDRYYQVVVDAMGDTSEEVRLEAVKALVHLHGPKVREILDKLMLDDSNAEVRQAAHKALMSIV